MYMSIRQMISVVTRIMRRSPHSKSDAKDPNYINQQYIKQITRY